MTASVAAMADAPQMAVPTPINVRTSPPTRSTRPPSQAIPRAAAKVPVSTGRDAAPVDTTWPSDSPKPSTTIDPWSTVFELKATPGVNRARGLLTTATAMPPTTATTGAPTIGTAPPTTVATTATAATNPTPGPTDPSQLPHPDQRGSPAASVAGGQPPRRAPPVSTPPVTSSDTTTPAPPFTSSVRRRRGAGKVASP